MELKAVVEESAHRSAIRRLGLDPIDAEIREVFFFDTPGLALDRHGVVARARRIQGRDDDTIVKLRPVLPQTIDPEFRESEGFSVEVDALPNGFVCSATLARSSGRGAVWAVSRGEKPIGKLFSKVQRRYLGAHAPDVDLDDLVVLGPFFVLKQRLAPKELRRRLVAEMWLYPDGSRLLELSTRCLVADAFATAVEVRTYLKGLEVEISAASETKTRRALRQFAEPGPEGRRRDQAATSQGPAPASRGG